MISDHFCDREHLGIEIRINHLDIQVLFRIEQPVAIICFGGIPNAREMGRERRLCVHDVTELVKLKLKVWERLENGEILTVMELD
jgi:hypothetical protein